MYKRLFNHGWHNEADRTESRLALALVSRRPSRPLVASGDDPRW